MSRRSTNRTSMVPQDFGTDVMKSGPVRFVSGSRDETALVEELEQESGDDDDWVSGFRPPSLSSLSLLLLANELDLPGKPKSN